MIDDLLTRKAAAWRPPEVAAPDLGGALAAHARRVRSGIAALASLVVLGGGIGWAVIQSGQAPVPAVPAASPSVAGVSAEDQSRLVEAVEGLLADHDTSGPLTSALAVRSTAGALRTLGSDTGLADDAVVWLLELEGSFPAAGDTYPYLRAYLDDSSPTAMIVEWREQATDLAQFGPVVQLPLPTVSAPAVGNLTPAALRAHLDGTGATALTSVQAFRTTLGTAQQRVSGHTPYPPSTEPVWLVQLEGSFDCPDCFRITTGNPKESVLVLAVAVADGSLGLQAVSARPIDLSGLGTPVEIDPAELSR